MPRQLEFPASRKNTGRESKAWGTHFITWQRVCTQSSTVWRECRGRISLLMCKVCIPSQPWQILLGSTTVINTSANVASGTAWQHLARRTARPHLPCSRWISIRLKACSIEIPSEHVLATLSFLWQNTWPQRCKEEGFICVHGFRGTSVHWGSNSMTSGGAPSLEKTRIQSVSLAPG